jgi:carbamoylphosphate synthase large subunit
VEPRAGAKFAMKSRATEVPRWAVKSTRALGLTGHSWPVKVTIRVEPVVEMPAIEVAIKMTTLVLIANTRPDQPIIAVPEPR